MAISRFLALVFLAALAAACVKVSFRRPPAPEELARERGLRDYYLEVAKAFATADPDGLAALYAPNISKPMTLAQIRAWAAKFFAEHGPARFHVEKLTLDAVGYRRATATLTYQVRTTSGKGDFGGTEIDEFEKVGERWKMLSWEKVP